MTIDAPSANVDFAPTFLGCSASPIPASMQGRPLEEALGNGAALTADAVRTTTHSAATPDGSYTVTGTFSIVSAGGRDNRYFDRASVSRK